ncbi:MAG: Phosphoglucosamine mutase [Phycisphaerae bacterium]|nr:Phosphoglucosamine mutase [Phycisphaerae bacterium]
MSLMVSVSGIRGIVGQSLTPEVVVEFARAYGTLLGGGRVVLGRDSRPSGEMFSCAAAAGLVSAGCEVTQLGIVMTPALGHAIREGRYSGGMNVTASHNPGAWNGLKLLDELGLAPDPQRAARVAEIRAAGSYRQVRAGFRPLRHDDLAGERHAEAVAGLVEVDVAALRGMRVVLDSVNGAGCLDTPAFLASLGCEVIHVNGEPSGEFAHEPEPLAENLMQLCEAVVRHKAAVGFAQDPDADRLALVDERGQFIGEEYTLALATRSVLSRRRGPVAANLSTSRMIDDIAREYGVPVIRTPVGEAHVARAMLASGCVIGGEGNGGVIDPRVSPVRDSLSAMSQVLQLMAATGKRVSELVASIPRYAGLKKKFGCDRTRIDAALKAVAGEAARRGARVDASDGIRIDSADGWVLIRASNTEPIVRVMAEARNDKTCESLVADICSVAGL